MPAGFTRETYIAHCFAEMERIVAENHRRIVAFVIEPLVQGAAGVLVHPDGYLRRVRAAPASNPDTGYRGDIRAGKFDPFGRSDG